MRKVMIYLRWQDSAIELEWTRASQEGTGLTEIETIGYLILKDDLHVQVTQSVYEDAEKYSSVMVIPKTVILDRRSLRFRGVKKD